MAPSWPAYIDLTGDDAAEGAYHGDLGRNFADRELKPGDFAELKNTLTISGCTIAFVEVKGLRVDDTSQEVNIRGIPYARAREVAGCRFPLKTNEVCQIVDVVDHAQVMITVRASDILKIRELHKTNAPYPAWRFGNDPSWNYKTDSGLRQRSAPLTCRWKVRNEYEHEAARRACKPYGEALLHLVESEIDDARYRASDKELRRRWVRGECRLSGPYRFGDAFCGAGGASSGARMAGLKVCIPSSLHNCIPLTLPASRYQPTIAIDNWDEACETFKRMFPGTLVFEEDMFEFITKPREHPYIHVLHISAPCQPWSPMHVRAGKNDEANQASLYAIPAIVDKIRPRVFTLEQTFGLGHDRHSEYFNLLLRSITAQSCSIQWRNECKLVQYGLPQNRRRMVCIGCAPGEAMPAWPSATHGSGPGQQAFVTEARAIDRLSRRDPLHDIDAAKRCNKEPRIKSARRQPFPKTILCTGALDLVHYSGKRAFTLRGEFET